MTTARLVFLVIALGVPLAIAGCAAKAVPGRSTDLKAVAARTAGAGDSIAFVAGGTGGGG